MCEGLSRINGPIPAHPFFLKETTFSSPTWANGNNSVCEGPSNISGPLASHYKNDNEKLIKGADYTVNPRVRETGKDVFNSHKNGNGVALLIQLQGRAIAPQTFKLRDQPKNHIAANTFKIKQLMRKVKERESQKEAENKTIPVKALWKSDKYKEVQSKIKELLQQPPAVPRDGEVLPPKREFLRAHSRTGGSVSRPQTARAAPTEEQAQMKINLNKKFASKDDLDFIRHNTQAVKQTQIKRAPSMEMLRQVQEKLDKDMDNYNNRNKGKLPNYLEQRKEELRKQHSEFIKNMPDPDQPPGHRKLPNDEKVKTLALLQESQQKLLAEFNSLPIRMDTFRIRTTKTDMEKRLVEIEEAIKIFSKPKVFVKIDQ